MSSRGTAPEPRPLPAASGHAEVFHGEALERASSMSIPRPGPVGTSSQPSAGTSGSRTIACCTGSTSAGYQQAAREKLTIFHLPKATRTALGKQGAKVAKEKRDSQG